MLKVNARRDGETLRNSVTSRKRFVTTVALTAAVFLGSLSVESASAGSSVSGLAAAQGTPAQEVQGTILTPLRFALDATYASWPGGQRQVWSVAGSNGRLGYTLALRCEEGGVCVDGGRFTLEVRSGATGLEDVDVTFCSSFNPVVSTGALTTRARGGEEFTIPSGSRFAIITMFDGLNAAFRFSAWESTDGDPRSRGLQPAPLPAAPGIYPTFG